MTLEHYFQAAKTLDPTTRKAILSAPTPARAKQLGKRVTLRPHWDAMRVNVMCTLLRRKFADPELGAMLLATSDRYLIEGNTWHDTFWGVCYCSRCDAQGENWLGRLLMERRAKLRKVAWLRRSAKQIREELVPSWRKAGAPDSMCQSWLDTASEQENEATRLDSGGVP